MNVKLVFTIFNSVSVTFSENNIPNYPRYLSLYILYILLIQGMSSTNQREIRIVREKCIE